MKIAFIMLSAIFFFSFPAYCDDTAAVSDTSLFQMKDAVPDSVVVVETHETPEDTVDTLAKSADTGLFGLNDHIGFNGITAFFSYVNQRYAKNTDLPQTYTFGFGINGDVLTGLSFIHLIPMFQYWQYSEDMARGFLASQTTRDISISFITSLVGPRISSRKARVFLGLGPSLHLSILSLYGEDDQYFDSNLYFTNGIGGVLGVELPLTENISFLFWGTYKHTFYWNTLQRKYLTLSLGLAV